jgi:hypothetical protein
MKNITVAALVAAPLLILALAVPSFAADPAPTTCKDGTTTTSTGKGTCSGHGGIQKAAKAKPATAASAPAPAAAPAAAPAKPAVAAPAAATAAKSSTATKSAPTATAGNTDPAGATAKCKDGTYSKSAHRSGTCSSHGGVAEWLTAAP